MALMDVAAERAVLAGICTYGSEAYFDVADIVNEDSFTQDGNAILYKCLKTIIETDGDAKVDIPSIYSTANILGLGFHFNKVEETKHLQAIMQMPIKLQNVRKFAAIIRKLQIARLMHEQVNSAQNELLGVKGNESYSTILGIVENVVFDFGTLLNVGGDEEPSELLGGITANIKHLMDNPVQQIGISSGFPVYDAAIGGGFRRGSVSMIGARTKAGKSVLAINVGSHVTSNLKIPVLYLDTEMVKEEQQIRLAARLTETPINDLENGKAGDSIHVKKRILDTLAKAEKENKFFFYKNVSGKPFEEILSIMRRWVMKNVGVDDEGKAKDCLIIYDYMKLMSSDGISQDMKEHQLLGFMMTSLHNFAVRYSVPVLSFIQLNRDGISKESTAAAAGSDRIMWLCSNFSIYKFKSDEEIADDSLVNGNRKLVPIIQRHGPGLKDGEYINMMMTGEFAKIVEGKTSFETKKDEGFVVDDEDEREVTPFD